MNKIPYVDRDSMNGSLRGECAYVWAVFLANEADMADDVVAYDKWKTIADQLRPLAQRPMVSSVHYVELENAIEEWTNGKRD